MTFNRILATAAVALCIGTTGAAWAASSTLTVVVGGEAYDGAPRFAVTFDGHELGQGVLGDAIDTATAGRFANAKGRSAYIQNFAFDIPEAVFKADGQVRVKLLNEAYGGDGSDHDRNLFLASVSVNGRTVTASDLQTATSEGIKPGERLDEFLIIHDGNEDGLSVPPEGGWPAPASMETANAAPAAAPAPAPPAEALKTELADARPEPKPAPAWMAAADPVPVAATEAPPKPRTPLAVRSHPQAVDVTETASLSPAVRETSSNCALDRVYNVIGFNDNSNDLTTRLKRRLDQIVDDIGTQKCTVLVTGYSSTQGAYATNALFAVERAQNVLRYLREQGLSYEKVSATGAGETNQFGPNFRANRRVVIAVSP